MLFRSSWKPDRCTYVVIVRRPSNDARAARTTETNRKTRRQRKKKKEIRDKCES